MPWFTAQPLFPASCNAWCRPAANGRFEQAANGLDHRRERAQAFGFDPPRCAFRAPPLATFPAVPTTTASRVTALGLRDDLLHRDRRGRADHAVADGQPRRQRQPRLVPAAPFRAGPRRKRQAVRAGHPSGNRGGPAHFNPVVEAMRDVRPAERNGPQGAVDGIAVCGKTGTVQTTAEDHSVFIAFAPWTTLKSR